MGAGGPVEATGDWNTADAGGQVDAAGDWSTADAGGGASGW